jgi:hypothetical protein
MENGLMRIVFVIAIPILLGLVPASMVWGLFDPGTAHGFFATLRRLVGGALALASFIGGAAGGLFLFH